MGCDITATVWVARPCVAHCVVEMIMKCMYVKRVNPSPFHVFKCIICERVVI